MLVFDPAKLFDVERWFNSNPGPGSMWHVIIGVAGLIVFFVGWYFYLFLSRRFREERYRHSIVMNVGQGMMYIGFITFCLCFFRIFDMPFFSMRLWLYLTLAVGLGLLIFFIYHMVRVYPEKMRLIARQSASREYAARAPRRPAHD